MRSAIVTLLLAFTALAPALFAQEDIVLKAMKDEMERSKNLLVLADMEKPYYIEYRVDEDSTVSIGATLGVLTTNDKSHSRSLTLQVRTGDYSLDNTNFLSVRSFGSRVSRLGQTRSLPLDDDYDQIRRQIWLATDHAYKQSASELAAKRSVLQTRKSTDNLPDFTPQSPVSLAEPHKSTSFDTVAAEKLARDVSAVFRDHAEILDSEVSVVARDLYTRYVNSEGTVFTHSEPVLAIRVRANTRAADGYPLEDSFSVFARTMDETRPGDLVQRAKTLAAGLLRLRTAASVELYNGPVLFEGEAAGAVLADVFAPAVAAARLPVTDEPQFETAMNQMFGQMGGTPLTDKLGGRVMPTFLSVTDKPRLVAYEGVPLMGTRPIDEEGVPTQDLNIVEAGVLKHLLATRTPTAQAKVSTGSKGLFGAVPSNLFLAANKTEGSDELRKHLVQLAKERGSDFGIVVRHASEGALSWIGRFAGSMGAPGAKDSSVIEMYKVFADGHEERVRGVEITSLNAGSFKDIVAVGDKPNVYNGPHVPMMTSIMAGFGGGNFSGDVLAIGSFVAPSILFEEVSVKRANVPAPNPPVAPSPLPAFTQK